MTAVFLLLVLVLAVALAWTARRVQLLTRRTDALRAGLDRVRVAVAATDVVQRFEEGSAVAPASQRRGGRGHLRLVDEAGSVGGQALEEGLRRVRNGGAR